MLCAHFCEIWCFKFLTKNDFVDLAKVVVTQSKLFAGLYIIQGVIDVRIVVIGLTNGLLKLNWLVTLSN